MMKHTMDVVAKAVKSVNEVNGGRAGPEFLTALAATGQRINGLVPYSKSSLFN